MPGPEAHDVMRVGPRIPFSINRMTKSPIASSVLILLFEENNSFNFILTLRSKKVETHKGQISLPGGVQEKNESLKDTALREAEEEIGVLPKTIEIIESYPPYTFHSQATKFILMLDGQVHRPNSSHLHMRSKG